MRIYTIYSKNGNVVLSTFDEDKAWNLVDLDAGESVDISTDDD